MTEEHKQKLMSAYIQLEQYMVEYRQAFMWLAYGNHKATPLPSKQETRELLKQLQEKITTLLADIASQIR
jgi:hypothetical protein